MFVVRTFLANTNLKYVKFTHFKKAEAIWLWWFLVLLLILFLQLMTLDVLPHIQQDEVQITDYGRLALNPLSEWSVTWLVEEGKPLFLWSYVGPLIAELSFQIGGTSGLGPRIASLTGGIFAASMVFGWLISRKVPVYAAFGLGIAFLLDPLFVLSQRMGRVDAWVMGFCLASCWILRLAKDRKRYQEIWLLTGAGALAAVAAFIWPSAIFLYPLVILELVGVANKSDITNKTKYLRKKIIFFGLGGFITGILLLLPIRNHILTIFSDMGSMVSRNVDASKSIEDQLLALFEYQHWVKLSKVYIKTLSPIFPILALMAIIIKREKGLILGMVVSMAIIFASLVYEFRALYLLPYFSALIGGLFIQNSTAHGKIWEKHFSKLFLGFLVLWSISISLVTRTVMGFESKTELDRNKIYNFASSSVGEGEHKVFLNYTYELYFAGRSLGWKIYTPYIQFSMDQEGNWIRSTSYEEDPAFTELLRQMDFAIFSEGSVNNILQQQLTSAGLHLFFTPNLIEEERSRPLLENNRNKEIVLFFLRGKDTYGSYVLYGRKKSL